MLFLSQVTFGVRTSGLIEAKLIGIIYLILAIIYLILMIGWLISRKNTLTNAALIIYIFQGVFSPVVMLVFGIILMLQGWRLDPLLQFQEFLLLLLIIYLSFKDIIINITQRIR